MAWRLRRDWWAIARAKKPRPRSAAQGFTRVAPAHAATGEETPASWSWMTKQTQLQRQQERRPSRANAPEGGRPGQTAAHAIRSLGNSQENGDGSGAHLGSVSRVKRQPDRHAATDRETDGTGTEAEKTEHPTQKPRTAARSGAGMGASVRSGAGRQRVQRRYDGVERGRADERETKP